MRKVLFFAFIPFALASYEGPIEGAAPLKPWLTGPLLGTSGNTVQAGHINIEPYIYAFAHTSFYNNDWKSESIETLWNLQFRVPFWVGVSSWLDFKVAPVWNWNYRDGKDQWTLGDFTGQINIQLHRATLPYKNWLPSVKLSIRETFPTGKYQKLDPKKLGTDGDGDGTWRTAFSINMSKVFYLGGMHFLNLYLDVLYSIPTTVHVKGFNAYGGGYGTDGTVHPEKTFAAIFSFEYAFTRNWAIACDFQGACSSKTTFSGTPGTMPADDGSVDPAGLPAANENMAAIQYSVAPAIEYNWSENLGLIAGVWFTVAGKNSSQFTTGVIALNYYR